MVYQLQYAIDGDDQQIVLNSPDPNLIALLTAGGHGFFELYNAGASEIVLVTSYAAPYFNLRRNEDAGPWPAGTYVAVDEITPLPLPRGPESQLAELLLHVTAGAGLVRLTPDPLTVQFALPTTGVVAGVYGGMQVDAYGRIVSIPNNWPTNALPVFSPGDTEGGGSDDPVTADLVGYTPALGAHNALGTDLQTVVRQLDNALFVVQSAATPVLSVAAGSGITLTGTATAPIVNLHTVAITPGTYAGFTVDGFGRVTAYAAPGSVFPSFAATAPITVGFASNTYTYAVSAAAIGAAGVVRLTDIALIAANTVVDTTSVPTYAGVIAAIDLRTATAAPLATDVNAVDRFSFYDVSAGKIAYATLATILNTAVSPGGIISVSAGVATLVVGVGITSVSRTGAGVVRVTLTAAQPSMAYHVDLQLRQSTPLMCAYDAISTTVFDCYFADAAGVLTDPSGISVLVEAL